MSQLHSTLDSIRDRVNIFLEIDQLCKVCDNILAACKQVHNKNELKISVKALYKRYLRYIENNKKNHGNNIFSHVEEEQIIGTITAWSLLNRALTRPMLFLGIKAMRSDLKNWNPRNWFKRFLVRFKDRIRLRKVKGLKKERICHSLDDNVSIFANWLNKFILEKKNDKYIMLNCDETMLSISGDQQKMKAIESVRKPKNNAIELKRGDTCSYIPIVSPFGLILSIFVLPAKENQYTTVIIKKASIRTRSSHGCYYLFTKSGYINGEAFTAILKVLRKELDIKYKNYEILLFLDRLSCHLVDSSLNYCKDNKITSIFLPASTSHILQPLDNGPFASFKQKIYQMLSDSLVTIRGDEANLGKMMLSIAIEAEDVINQSVLSSAFKKTGLFPFSKSVILKNLKINLGKQIDDHGTNESNLAEKITKNILEHRVLKLNTTVVKIKPAHNQLFTGNEILALREKQNMEKQNKKSSSHRNNQSRANPKRKRNNNVANIDSVETLNFVCFSESHLTKNINSNREKHICQYCNEYVFCDFCFNNQTEAFMLHEIECGQFYQNSKKKKEIFKSN